MCLNQYQSDDQSHGAIGWSSVPKRMARQEGQLTFNPSTSMLPGRHATLSHPFTKWISPSREIIFDARNGYHSVPLHPDDRHFTTFITPWGCYKYCTAPQGYIASGDRYTRRYDEITSSIPNKSKCVDGTFYGLITLRKASSKHRTR